MSIVAAVGPFTTTEDNSYAPLTELLDYCAQHQPDVLLLMGPFVDSEHPAAQDGSLEDSFEDLFQIQVTSLSQR